MSAIVERKPFVDEKYFVTIKCRGDIANTTGILMGEVEQNKGYSLISVRMFGGRHY